MKRLILPFVALSSLCASEQIILVTSDDFNTSTAQLQRYELDASTYRKVGPEIAVNIGRNGLGWGAGGDVLSHRDSEQRKREGDGRAPAGIFPLQSVFGYATSADTAMPYMQATADLICVDDSNSPHYNTITPITGDVVINSFEWMKRKDDLYALGVTVAHNPEQVPQNGSCIFLHVQKGVSSPTAGCTSMTKEELETVVRWLDPAKKPHLVQIPKAYCSEVESRYPGMKCQ